MGRPKKNSGEATIESGKDDFVNSLIKEFGPVVFNAERNAGNLKKMVIPYSPANDLMFGGGIKEGSLVVTNGVEKSGKSVSSLDFAATAQDIKYSDDDMFPDGRRVFFFSVEGRLQERDINGIHHLDHSRFDWIQPAKGHILTADKILDMATRAITQIPGCIVIIDSISQLSTTDDIAAGYSDQLRPGVPKMLSKFCKEMARILPINNNIVIAITHRMANQAAKPGQSQWTEGGGNKIQYQADFKMKTNWSENWMIDETKIGKIIHWECGTTALDRPVTTKSVSRFRFGYGIDKQGEIIDVGLSLGLVERNGAWYDFPGYSNMKAQGFEKARELLVQRPEVFDDLNKKFRTMMGFDKYNIEE